MTSTPSASSGSPPLVVAANRLPVMRGADGTWMPSPGGLVRALLPMLRDVGGAWVGWTGVVEDDAEPFSLDGVDLVPVKLSPGEHDDYYEGFSNDSLWPLYHDAVRESTFKSQQWESYVAVNERFADRLAEVAPPGAVIWVHDYHLQLVPAMIRERRPDAVVGFFLHIPFPPWELFTRLPWRSEIIEGLLGADLVGFQRLMGAENFGSIAQRLGLAEPVTGEVRVSEPDEPEVLETPDGRLVKIGAFPISIEFAEFNDVAAERNVRRASAALRSRLGNPEVVLLGVDRLDYTKGIGARMRAFRSLLDDGTLDADRCVMIQVATPTREAVEHYQDERHEIERLVGEINGRHSRIGQPALHYLYRSLPLEDLVALYLVGDVMVVTPLRDGMNLVAKEYVASRRDVNGVLVLSEFAGAADQLTDAVLVNPHDEDAMRAAIVHAIEMNHTERTRRMAALRDAVARSDVRGWADRFLADLTDGSLESPPEDGS